MATTDIEITMHGNPGSITIAEFGKLLSALQDLTNVVASDREISGAEWRITDLKLGSALLVASYDVPVRGDELAQDLVEGLAELAQDPVVPSSYPVNALPASKRVGRTAGRHPVTLRLLQGGQATAQVDKKVADNAARASRVKHRSLGGFYGRIVLADERRKRPQFGLRDEFTQRYIPCTADQEVMNEAVRLFGHRVYAAGEVDENLARQPLRLRATSVEEQPWTGASVERFRGISPEKGDSASYIRSQRDW